MNTHDPRLPWRVSDKHGLCIVDADENVIADLDSDLLGVADLNARDNANLIVALVNGNLG